jgi:hypothetical protein
MNVKKEDSFLFFFSKQKMQIVSSKCLEIEARNYNLVVKSLSIFKSSDKFNKSGNSIYREKNGIEE